MVQILDADGRALHFGHDLCVVAAVTGEPRMLANQWIAGFTMVKLRGTSLPLDDVELDPVVLGMAVGAIFSGCAVLDNYGVIPSSGDDTLLNLLVAGKAFQAWRASTEDVARAAVGGPAEMIVRFRERTWRDLSQNWQTSTKQQYPQPHLYLKSLGAAGRARNIGHRYG